MIKTAFEVEIPVWTSQHSDGSHLDDTFVTVYSAWMGQEHIKYLYAHGEIVESEIDDVPLEMSKRYTVSWGLPEEHEIWFILKWGAEPGVQTL